MLEDGGARGFLDFEIISDCETNGAQQAKGVLFEAPVGIADGAQEPGAVEGGAMSAAGPSPLPALPRKGGGKAPMAFITVTPTKPPPSAPRTPSVSAFARSKAFARLMPRC